MCDVRGGVGAGDCGGNFRIGGGCLVLQRGLGDALGLGDGKDSHGAVRGQERERER